MKQPAIARRFTLIVGLFFAFVATADAQTIRTFRGRTMGTTYMVKIFGADEVSDDIRMEIDAELRRVNDQMSTYLKSSELSRFNAFESTEWFDVSPETAQVVQFAQTISKLTNGAFDVTVGSSVNAWGFGKDKRTGDPVGQDKLEELRKSIDYKKLNVRTNPPALQKLIPQLQVDLSAIAKGHGVDRVLDLLDAAGAKDVFVEIGGEVRTSGSKAGDPWKVGIQRPDAEMNEVLIAHAMGGDDDQGEAMATSGDYRNFFENDGKRYSHTIDPATGAPINNNLASVSVVSKTCMAADAWATALNVLGPGAAMRMAKKEQLDAFLITRTEDGYKMMGTGILAQYAESVQPVHSSVAPLAQDTGGLLPTALAAAVVMGLILTGMAVGVIFGRKSISGSCGGIANQTNEDGSSSCALCSNPSDACKELREQMQKETT